MLDRKRKAFLILSGLITLSMLLCIVFGWHRSRHSNAWQLSFYGLLLLNSFLQYRQNLNKPQPDTISRLFPHSTQATSGKTKPQ